MIKGKIENKTDLIYSKDYDVNKKYPFVDYLKRDKEMKVINFNTKMVYDTIKIAAKENKMPYHLLRYMLNGRQPNTSTLIYYKDFEEGKNYKSVPFDYNRYKHLSREVINTESGIIHDSAKTAAETTSYGYSSLLKQLTGKARPKTPLLYLTDYLDRKLM